MDKVVVFGGTFNPIHFGHMRCAIEVSEALSVPRVVFMPAATSPHKGPSDDVGADTRLLMAKLGVSGKSLFEVSEMEIKRGSVSYTVDTVNELVAQGLAPTLIVGADQFNVLSTWVDYEQILRLADIAVVPRPGIVLKSMEEALPVEVAGGFCYDKKSASYINKEGRRITFVNSTLMGISSSDIRRRVSEGRSISYLVSSLVENFIKENRLYLQAEKV
ncbi:Nicotinate-nucleotide adenylyltransferase [hydrothermal vent metagenome]|uniref:Nicotinate-nucleotide adenylyltransferase n=1 Tax=hydrothermal vent metagenome TaxID=652676 RepID=A0A3B0RIF2_9ZZZZ